ncbi:MAG: hypothetical protein HQ518_24075 [Rhodopirellula sp.]|nr:hypothetical protein [Rhodopirellula sp.]
MNFDNVSATTELITDRRSANRRVSRKSVAAALDVELDVSDDEEEVREALPERRTKVERRRQIDPTTCERDYGDAEVEFMGAMDNYKRRSGRQFPTWSEVLEVLHSLGYRKVAEPVEIEL